MHNAIEAANRANARLIFFDNVYMYGKVGRPILSSSVIVSNGCSLFEAAFEEWADAHPHS